MGIRLTQRPSPATQISIVPSNNGLRPGFGLNFSCRNNGCPSLSSKFIISQVNPNYQRRFVVRDPVFPEEGGDEDRADDPEPEEGVE